MPRKARSDSAAALLGAMVNAALPLPELPGHIRLRDEDRPFWVDIARTRARDEWSPADLVVAAQLARCQRDIEVESLRLEEEGSVIENQRGTPVMNPRHSVLQQLAQREMALMRAIQLGGSAKGDKRDKENARKLQRQAESVRSELASDELLAQ